MSRTSTQARDVGLLLVALLALAVVVLGDVLGTVFFAITLAYVLYPARRQLSRRGLTPRLASAALTLLVVLLVLALLAPPLVVLYQRRVVLIAYLQSLPATVEFGLAGFTYVVESADIVETVGRELSRIALSLARNAAVLAMKLFLFVFLMYALLLRPGAVRRVGWDLVPATLEDAVTALHDRTRRTLFAIYVVQVATGALTFVVALPVFYLLGYDAFFTLSVLAGILQFLPVVGPSIVVLAIGLFDVAVGNVARAAIVIPVGLVVIGALPDAVIRPQLAHRTAGLPASLYFVGFVGGVLTVGPIGIIAGPLVIALVLEAVRLYAEVN